MTNSNYVWKFLLLISFAVIVSCEKDISITPEDGLPPIGKIIFNSDPQGAEIFVNGDNTGKFTPDSIIFLEPGEYQVKLRHYPYLDIIDSVIVEETNPEHFMANFAGDTRNFGTIYFTSDPSGAMIYLRDSCLNRTTPSTITQLWPGLYNIKCTYPEHREKRTYVLVRGGEDKTGFVKLQDTSKCVDYNPSNSNFPSVQTMCVEVDKNNYKWVGLPGTGLVRFTETESILYNSSNSDLPNDYINCITIDEQNNKWIGTPGGLTVIDNSGNWVTYTLENSSIPHDRITAVAFDNQGNTWIGATDPNIARLLIKFDGNTFTSYPAPDLIVSLAVDHSNRLWVGLNTGFRLFVNETWENIVTGLGANHHLRGNPIETIAVDVDGKVWVGAGATGRGFTYIPGGLYLFEGNNFTRVSLDEDLITHIHITSNGNKWISTLGRYPINFVEDTRIRLINIKPGGQIEYYNKVNTDLPGGLLRGSSSDDFGNLWIASRDIGIVKFKNIDQ